MNKKKVKFLMQTLPFAIGITLGGVQAYAVPTMGTNEMSVNQSVGKVSGVVVDETGEPLIGVSVFEKGNKTNAAVTDANGAFTLNASNHATLVFTYVGFKSQEVAVAGKSKVNITLYEDSESLDEVVVIGYGTVKKADLAGSVSVMDSKAFRDQPITQASDALQGRVAGVNVVSDGIPGGSVKIRIRGTNSINKSNDPLYVVDGMVRESGLEGINPEDIQSMQILKDASSTAIYGSRGANGVVIITTKTGHKGESKITFDASWGFSNATKLPEKMNAQEYAQALVNYDGINETTVQDYLNGTKQGVDWVDTMFRTGWTQNYKLVFTKGTEGLQAYVSGNYMKHEGTLVESQYERYSVKANVKAKMTNWLDVTFDVNASRGVGKGTGGLGVGANLLWSTFTYSPTIEMQDANGNYNKDPYSSIQDNPYGQAVENKSERRHDVLNGHIDLQFNILPGLTFTSSNGIDYYNNTYYNFSSKKVVTTNSMGNNNYQRTMLQSTNNLTYTHTWADKHNLTATAVWEATKSETRGMGISGSNLQVESVGWWDVTNASTREASNSYSDWSLLSGVARVMYNYDNRYMLTGTFRADGSSRLSNNKWGYFPSVAAAWTVSNEKFMESTRDVISNLKIRASYGIIGNQDITPYSTLGLLSTTTTYFGTASGVTGYAQASLATPDLKWEKTKQFDLGFDLGLFNDRLELSFDYFNKETSDALLSTSLANYMGGTSYYVNAGKVANTGFDIALTARIIETNDWTWTSTLNGTYLKNEVKKLTTNEPAIYSGGLASIISTGDCTMITEGEALGTLIGYEWAGIDSEGYDTYYTASGEVTRKPTAYDDYKVLGKATPDFTLGWNNTVRYKNWSLNAFFNSAFGVQRMNLLRFAMHSKAGNWRMFTAKDYVSEIGHTMANPNVDNNFYAGNSSKYVENADYFRCENITLSYDLPKSVAKIADFRFSFSVQNLFTITGYKGSNPAGYTFGSDTSELLSGLDMGAFPTPRTFTFGVRMNF